MSLYRATICWRRGSDRFDDHAYSRAHEWIFDGGRCIPASSSPHIVPVPMSVAENVDPEEAFVASLSSCHMLFFLSLAAEQGIVVDEYADAAEGRLGRNADGKMAMTTVVLRPRASYPAGGLPQHAKILELHHRAHQLCFIANSVRTEVVLEVEA